MSDEPKNTDADWPPAPRRKPALPPQRGNDAFAWLGLLAGLLGLFACLAPIVSRIYHLERFEPLASDLEQVPWAGPPLVVIAWLLIAAAGIGPGRGLAKALIILIGLVDFLIFWWFLIHSG